MSKFLKMMVALLAIAAIAAPAIASDLSVTGQMRVEGYYNDQDSMDDSTSWFEQRMRVNSVWKVSDDVKARLRLDFEDYWGRDGQYTLRNTPHTTSQSDYAYLQIDKEMWTLVGGQAYFGGPNAILVDHVGTGLALSLKMMDPVSLKLQFTKYDENGGKTDEDATDDTNFYSGELGYSSDDYSVSGIIAMLDNAATDDNQIGYGLAVNFNVAAFAIKAELDFLDGDNGAGTDYVGTQLYLDASTDVSEALNVGGWFWYMMGTDKADEQVISYVTNWDTFNPFWGGYVGSAVVAADPITGWGPASITSNAGLIAAALYATYNASDDLGLKFQGSYAMEDEDAFGDFDLVTLTGSAKYELATNTYLMGDVIYNDLSSDSDGDDDSISLWTQLQVNF